MDIIGLLILLQNLRSQSTVSIFCHTCHIMYLLVTGVHYSMNPTSVVALYRSRTVWMPAAYRRWPVGRRGCFLPCRPSRWPRLSWQYGEPQVKSINKSNSMAAAFEYATSWLYAWVVFNVVTTAAMLFCKMNYFESYRFGSFGNIALPSKDNSRSYRWSALYPPLGKRLQAGLRELGHPQNEATLSACDSSHCHGHHRREIRDISHASFKVSQFSIRNSSQKCIPYRHIPYRTHFKI